MEAINSRRLQGIAKVSGVVLCLAGILTMTFYRGPHLTSFNHHHHLLGQGHSHSDQPLRHSHNKWVSGTFLTLSLWMVLQCLFSTVQSFFVALAFERDFTRWKLGLDINLISVAYGSIIGLGVSYYLQSWTIDKRGPVFLAYVLAVNSGHHDDTLFISPRRTSYFGKCNRWKPDGWRPLQCPPGKE